MRKLKIYVVIVLLVNLCSSACKTEPPNEKMGISKISGICRGQKIFFRQKGRYATLTELVNLDLADNDTTRGWGYKSEVKITATGFVASVTPIDFTKASMFYVDETGVIKKHSGNPQIHSNDPVCGLEEGCFCVAD
jgi:hypothetical protein